MDTFLINYSFLFFYAAKIAFYFSLLMLVYSIFAKGLPESEKIKYFKITGGIIAVVLTMSLFLGYEFKKIDNKVSTLKASLKTEKDKSDLINSSSISPFDTIRLELAKNRSTPPDTLKLLINDEAKKVRDYSLANLQRRRILTLNALDYQYSPAVAFVQDHLSIISIVLTILLIIFGSRIQALATNRKLLVSILVGNMMVTAALEEMFVNHDSLRNYTLEYVLQNKVASENEIGQWIVMMNDSGIQFLVSNRRYLPTESLKLLLIKDDVDQYLKVLIKKELIARNEYPSLEDESLGLPFEKDQNFNSL